MSMFSKAFKTVQDRFPNQHFNITPIQNYTMPAPQESPDSIFSQQLSNQGLQLNANSTKVLIVSNLPDQTSSQMLFKLFGVYGNVMKVKILFKKRDTALIEYQTVESAQLGKQYLNGLHFFGKTLTVNDSKYKTLTINN